MTSVVIRESVRWEVCFDIILKPFTRLILGLIAIPVFRFILKRVFRQHGLDKELGKDLEEWFRGALLLLVATANMEHLLFSWIQNVDWLDRADWFTMGLRLMLAIGVIEAMPDQELFAVMYPGPPRLHKGENVLRQIWRQKITFLKGFVCRHLNRSSPVLAMMCAIVGAELPSMEHVSSRHRTPRFSDRLVLLRTVQHGHAASESDVRRSGPAGTTGNCRDEAGHRSV